MVDVFISYSRREGEFVQRLNTAFDDVNRVVWIDWQSIPRGGGWWHEIELGVEHVDAFMCIISEHWLTMKYVIGNCCVPARITRACCPLSASKSVTMQKSASNAQS